MLKPRQFRSGLLLVLTLPAQLMAQAAAEYALRSAGSAAAAGAPAVDSGAYIAGCSVNSTLFTCLNHSYPRGTIVVAALLFVFILRWFSGFSRVR